MHNHVVHSTHWRVGVNGFRVWTDNKPPADFVPCPCGYAGLQHYARKDFVEYYLQNPEWYKRRVRALERSLKPSVLLIPS
jgi:hypothetical protein